MVSARPNPPLGPYPQFRLCRQEGNEPINIKTSKTTRTVPNIKYLLLKDWMQTTRQQNPGSALILYTSRLLFMC